MNLDDVGLTLIDVQDDQEFARRPLRVRDPQVQAAGMAKLAQVCMANGDSILQDLADCLLGLCDADSAGISMKSIEEDGLDRWSWLATAGELSGLAGTRFTDLRSPSGVAFERNRPHLFRIEGSFFKSIGVDIPPATDGLVVPWHFGNVQRTIWIMAHRDRERFDQADLSLIVNFGVIAAQAFEYRKLLQEQHRQWAATTASALTDLLAYRINEPLRNMDSLIAKAARGDAQGNAKTLARELSDLLQELNQLVAEAFSPGSSRKPN